MRFFFLPLAQGLTQLGGQKHFTRSADRLLESPLAASRPDTTTFSLPYDSFKFGLDDLDEYLTWRQLRDFLTPLRVRAWSTNALTTGGRATSASTRPQFSRRVS
jgi:hypothetical protein